MKRRDCLVVLGALAVAPFATASQRQNTGVHRIGFLFLGIAFASGYLQELEWVRSGLRKLGYVGDRP